MNSIVQTGYRLLREPKRSARKNLLWISLLICLHSELLHAQAWSKADSAWLTDALAGKDTIRLNPEFQRAIRNGTFLNLGEPLGKMQLAPSSIPITKDFAEYMMPADSLSASDTTLRNNDGNPYRKLAWKDLPPGVLMRYGLDGSFASNDPYVVGFGFPRSATPKPATGLSLSFNHALSMAFSPSYRRLAHNRKHATAWKTYNDLPTPDVHRKQRQFRNAHPELVLSPFARKRSQADSLALVRNNAQGIDSLLLDPFAADRLALQAAKADTAVADSFPVGSFLRRLFSIKRRISGTD